MQVTESTASVPVPEPKPLVGRSKELHTRLQKLQRMMLERECSTGHVLFGSNYQQNCALADKVTLAQFLAASKYDQALRTELVGRCMLQRNIDEMNKHIPFEYNLEDAPLCLLDNVTLHDLQTAGFDRKATSTQTYLALVEDFRFNDLNIIPLKSQGYLTEECWQTIALRLDQQNDKGANTSFHPFSPPSSSWIRKKRFRCSVTHFRQLSPQELEYYASQIPAGACALVSDAQLKGLNLTKFSSWQLDCMLRASGGEETLTRRLELLSQTQRDALGKHLKTPLRQHVVDYSTLALHSLSPLEIEALLQSDTICDKSLTAERFHQIPPKEVAAAIHKINHPWYLTYLSEEQVKALDFSKLSAKKIGDLVSWIDSDQKKRAKIRHIPIREIPRLIHRRKCDGSEIEIKHLTDEQLRVVDFKLVDRELFHHFLPPFTLRDFGYGRKYTQVVKEDALYHLWVDSKGEKESHKDTVLTEILDHNKRVFPISWARLTHEQKKQVSKRLGWKLEALESTISGL